MVQERANSSASQRVPEMKPRRAKTLSRGVNQHLGQRAALRTGQGQVDGGALPVALAHILDLAGEGVDAALMAADEEHAGISVEHILRAVACQAPMQVRGS